MALQNWQSGEPITALRLQKMTDAIKQNSANIQNIGRLGAFAGEGALSCAVHNALDRDIELGECFGLGEQAIEDNITKRVMIAEEIDEEKHRRRFAIAGKLFKADIIERCYISGVCQARVFVEDAAHIFATPRDGKKALCSDVCGPAVILWKETDGTGEMWAVVYVKPHVHGTDENPFQDLEPWELFKQPEENDGWEAEFKVRKVGDSGDGQWLHMRWESLGHLVKTLGPGDSATTTETPTTTEPAETTAAETTPPFTTPDGWTTSTETCPCCSYEGVIVNIGNAPCITSANGSHLLVLDSVSGSYPDRQCNYEKVVSTYGDGTRKVFIQLSVRESNNGGTTWNYVRHVTIRLYDTDGSTILSEWAASYIGPAVDTEAGWVSRGGLSCGDTGTIQWSSGYNCNWDYAPDAAYWYQVVQSDASDPCPSLPDPCPTVSVAGWVG